MKGEKSTTDSSTAKKRKTTSPYFYTENWEGGMVESENGNESIKPKSCTVSDTLAFNLNHHGLETQQQLISKKKFIKKTSAALLFNTNTNTDADSGECRLGLGKQNKNGLKNQRRYSANILTQSSGVDSEFNKRSNQNNLKRKSTNLRRSLGSKTSTGKYIILYT